MVRAFVVGNFLLGFLLAVISSAMFYAMQLPYPFLVGPLSGLLSLVPYVGLPMAMLPPKGRTGGGCIIVGPGNADPYIDHEDAIEALADHFGLGLDRAHCYPYRR